MVTHTDKVAVLKRLERENGHLAPEDVVNEARDEASPLHDLFEWDDTVAAAKFRVVQAQSLIRSVRLNVSVGTIPLSAPAYVRDLRSENRGYRAILQVRSEEEIARLTVIDAMQRASNAIKRAKTLALYLGIEDLVEEAHALIGEIVQRANTIQDEAGGTA